MISQNSDNTCNKDSPNDRDLRVQIVIKNIFARVKVKNAVCREEISNNCIVINVNFEENEVCII